MGFVLEGVGSVGEEERDGYDVDILECYGVVFFGFLLGFRENVFVFKGDPVWEEPIWGWAETNVDYGGDFPEFENNTHDLGKENHPTYKISLIFK